jgi:hypothetical protein
VQPDVPGECESNHLRLGLDPDRHPPLEPERRDTGLALEGFSSTPGLCRASGLLELTLTGTVTGGTSTYTRSGDPVTVEVCVTEDDGVTLAKGSIATI